MQVDQNRAPTLPTLITPLALKVWRILGEPLVFSPCWKLKGGRFWDQGRMAAVEVAAEALEVVIAITGQMNQTDRRQAGQKGSSSFRLPLTWKVWATLRVGLRD